MRCPKCQYISFDSGDRCRNCGYDFSLAVSAEDLDLPIQNGTEPLGPLSDLKLTETDAPGPGYSAPEPAPPENASRDSVGSGPLDLPLFGARADDDRPLVAAPAAPRAPLSVRRASPVPSVVRPKPRDADRAETPTLALDLDTPETRVRASSVARHDPEASPQDAALVPAPWGRRLLAAAIDAVIMGSIDVTVLYFTMRLCGLQTGELRLIPVVPFTAFLLLLNGGYFATFTAAAGQTIGKMAAGIRVIAAPEDAAAGGRVPFGSAVLRAAAYLVSVVPVGLGMIPALFSLERRALHDRLADTRVVKS